jgi:hypothetical protein
MDLDSALIRPPARAKHVLDWYVFVRVLEEETEANVLSKLSKEDLARLVLCWADCYYAVRYDGHFHGRARAFARGLLGLQPKDDAWTHLFAGYLED